jgi:arylsulfatase/arylsulfatase A
MDSLGLTENTLVVYIVDNGPWGRRYVAGMKGWKTQVHEGGVRSPFLIQWPGVLEPGAASDVPAAHIDMMPTLLDAAGVDLPSGLQVDGRSLLPLLRGEEVAWPDRPLVIQSHRGDVPVRYHHFMLRNARWKLVHPSGFDVERFDGPPRFELYDLSADPLEMQDVAARYPDTVAALRATYDAWFDDVGQTRPDNYAPPPIYIGTTHDNPVVLTRQDWRHTDGRPWARDSNGYWVLYAPEAGTYDVRLRFPAFDASGDAVLQFGDAEYRAPYDAGSTEVTFAALDFGAGDLRLQATLSAGRDVRGPYQVDVIHK